MAAAVAQMGSAVRVGTIVTPARRVVRCMATKKGTQGKALSTKDIVGRDLWIPYSTPPDYLDGSMVGDRGFDPLGLAKPTEYLQFDLDGQDINGAKQSAGRLLGRIRGDENVAPTEDALQPYSEVFNIQRFRECELIHGRWCMLATLGCVVAELVTGVSWVDAGKVELAQASYFNLNLPFTVTELTIFEALAVGGVEVLRNSELDPEKRVYPGGPFDPLNLAADPERAFQLKTAEIKHARLAMVAFFGFAAQAAFTGDQLLFANLKNVFA